MARKKKMMKNTAAKKRSVRNKKAKKTKKKGAQQANSNAEKWDDEYVRMADEVYGLGGGPKDLAKMCRCSLSTIYRWLTNNPEFKAAADEGEKRFLDDAETVYKKGVILEATPHNEVTVKVKDIALEAEDEGIEMPATQTETITKRGQFKLKNIADLLKRRRPEKYGDKVEHKGAFTLADLAAMAQSDEDS